MNNFVLPPWKRIELGDPMLITDTVDSLRQELNAIYQYTDRKAQLCPQPSTDGLVYFIGDLVMITKL